jgi:hypothetical protein
VNLLEQNSLWQVVSSKGLTSCLLDEMNMAVRAETSILSSVCLYSLKHSLSLEKYLSINPIAEKTTFGSSEVVCKT